MISDMKKIRLGEGIQGDLGVGTASEVAHRLPLPSCTLFPSKLCEQSKAIPGDPARQVLLL